MVWARPRGDSVTPLIDWVGEPDATEHPMSSVPWVRLDEVDLTNELADTIPRDAAMRYVCAPISRAGGTLVVAMRDPDDLVALDALDTLTGLRVEPTRATESSILEAIGRLYARTPRGDEADREDPVVGLARRILLGAADQGATLVRCEQHHDAQALFFVWYEVGGQARVAMNPLAGVARLTLRRFEQMAGILSTDATSGTITLRDDLDGLLTFQLTVVESSEERTCWTLEPA
jgi:hypothetical protein